MTYLRAAVLMVLSATHFYVSAAQASKVFAVSQTDLIAYLFVCSERDGS